MIVFNTMSFIKVSDHIALLIEPEFAVFNRASVWLVIRVHALMREELVQAFEHLHACAIVAMMTLITGLLL